MKPSDVEIGDLIITRYGLATVMKFNAPSCVGCMIVTTDPKYKPGSPGYKNYAQGEWIYIRGLDFIEAKLIKNIEKTVQPDGQQVKLYM